MPDYEYGREFGVVGKTSVSKFGPSAAISVCDLDSCQRVQQLQKQVRQFLLQDGFWDRLRGGGDD